MRSIALVLLITFSITGFSQQKKMAERKESKFNVQVTEAIFLGRTQPVSELIKISLVSEEKILKMKEERKVPDNFKGRKTSKIVHPEKENQGADPLRVMGSGGATNEIEPTVNIDGIGDFGSPHDPTGDVGLDHFVQAVNVTDVGVFNKDGLLLEEFAMGTLWAGLGYSSAGDPIILYDETAERWLITEFADPANLLVAVSETSDPLGSYFAYSFSTPEFPDYPKYSIWPEAYLVTTNESGAGIHTQYFIDRQAMLNGESNVTIQQVEVLGSSGTEQGFIVSTPVDWDGATLPNTLPMVLSLDDSSWGNVDDDAVRLISFDVDFDNPDNTSVSEVSLVTTPYDSYPCSDTGFGFQCIPQLGGGGLDGIPEVIMNVPKYRNFGAHESIVCCFVTDVTNGGNLSGIRWMEMRKEGGGDWYVYQEGTHSPDGDDRYMGSIAIDADGNIGLGYSVSSEDRYASLCYTGRYANDPLGAMTVAEYVAVEGEGPINSFGRYGDYAQMSVDPVDGNTFWFTSEYARDGGSGVGTRIVAFQLLQDTFDLAITHIVSPISASVLSTAELLTIEVTNAGLEPMSNYTLSFDFEGVLQESVLITTALNPGQTYLHSFTVPMNMSANGVYEVSATVSHPDDTGEFNNTLTVEIENQFALDMATDFSLPLSTCGSEVTIPLNLVNNGGDMITNGEINVYVNEVLVETIDWVGSIAPGSSVVYNILVSGLAAGSNDIAIEFINPNGAPDEAPIDNLSVAVTNVILEGGLTEILIHTDNYPEETTWTLEDEQGNELLSGGPYSSDDTDYTQAICLAQFSCYTFTIEDSYGDGICCAYGNGFFEITDGNNIIVASGGEFGYSQIVDFCLGECYVQADIDVTTDSGLNDGAIFITASNGVAGYQYSIDGGSTFQSEPLFENLAAGSYDIVVLSGDGICEYEETVFVLLVSVSEIYSDVSAIVKPNPNNGFFTIELTGVPGGVSMMHYQVIDASGKLIQDRTMSRYDGIFTSRVSLLAHADGVYYIRFIDQHLNELFKVIKKS